tara:strand:- start:184 stop:348 length:165 start_codon:yes stop_codon:yes gene_type:complete
MLYLIINHGLAQNKSKEDDAETMVTIIGVAGRLSQLPSLNARSKAQQLDRVIRF